MHNNTSMFSTLTNSPKRKLSAACYACGNPHGTCVHTRSSSDNEKQWTFQQENQQTILHPQSMQSHAMQQASTVKVQHRKLSNGSLVPEPDKLVASTSSPLPNNNYNNMPPAGVDDADKTYQIYHWKCDMGNSRSGKHRSNTIPVSTQQQQQQAAAVAASLKVELPVQTTNQPQQQQQQQQVSPIVSPSTPPIVPAMPINLAAPSTPTGMVMLSKPDYDKLVQRIEVLEQANFTLLQQVHALNNQQSQILMLLQNCLGQQQQQQQSMHLGTQMLPQQDAATEMELQLDLDDDIRNFVAKAAQQQQLAPQHQHHPVRPAVQIRQSNQSAQFTVLNAPQQQPQPSIVLNGPSQSPKVLYHF